MLLSKFWIDDKEDFNRSHVTFKDHDNVKNAILIIQNVELADKGSYNCSAKNEAIGFQGIKEAKEGTFVRVRGKLM